MTVLDKSVRLVVVFLGSLLLSISAWSQAPRVVPGEYLIKYRVDMASSQVISKIQSKVNLKAAFPEMNMLHFSVKPGQEGAIEEIKNDPEVLFVEPNYILEKLDDDGQAGQIVDSMSFDQVSAQASSSFSQNYSSKSSDMKTSDGVLTQVGSPSGVMEPLKGFAKDLPLVAVMRQITPNGWIVKKI